MQFAAAKTQRQIANMKARAARLRRIDKLAGNFRAAAKAGTGSESRSNKKPENELVNVLSSAAR